MATRFFEVDPKAESCAGIQQPRLGLVIGNSAYQGARLKNAAADAELIAGALRGLNFGVTLLVDASKPDIEHALIDFGLKLGRAGRKAIGIFYFAGHGVQSDGQNFLIPIDANIADTAYLRSGAVSVELLIEEFAKAPSAAKVMILDACRNNPIPEATRATRDLQQGLASMRDVPDATLIVFSTAADTVAFDGSSGNGPYATALAAALPTPNRLLHEIMFDVSRQVIDATDGLQRPALFIQGAMPAVKMVEADAGPATPISKYAPEFETNKSLNVAGLAPLRIGPFGLALCGLGFAILLACGLFIYNWPWPGNGPALSKSAALRPVQPENPLGATESKSSALLERHESASDVSTPVRAVTSPSSERTSTANASAQAQRNQTDPTRLALPIPVLSVANDLKLSTEVAELIFLQSAVGLIESKRYTETVPDLRSLAEAGQPIAQFWLAYLYYKGFGVGTDMEVALHWFKLAAEQGLPFAQQFAGTMLMESKRSASERGLGALWLNLAAKQGYEPAIDTLKRFKLRPNPSTPSLDAALRAFDANNGAEVLSAAKVFVDNNSGFAAYLSGRVLFEGRGIAADSAAGVVLLKKAARQQVGEAMELLARAYGEGAGTDQNKIEAVAWARLAVRNTLDKGHAAMLMPTAVRMRAAAGLGDLATLDKVLPPITGETASP